MAEVRIYGGGSGGEDTRDDLVKRIELVETMIAEGRRSTVRFGWIFVFWGVIYFAATVWAMFLPGRNFAWPVCITVAIVVLGLWGRRIRRERGHGMNPQSRSVNAVWGAMGCSIMLFIAGAVVSHHVMGPVYMAAILFFVGQAHATSALILRWKAQGFAAAVWLAGGVSVFFATMHVAIYIFLVATFFGQIVFGLYAMAMERKYGSMVAGHV